jgi:hypothetical protein
MAMLATMAGNDLMEFDEVKRFHSRLLRNLGWNYSVDNKFKAIADFVWNYLEGRNSRMIVDVMASEINWKEKERLKPLIRKSIEMYHTVRD